MTSAYTTVCAHGGIFFVEYKSATKYTQTIIFKSKGFVIFLLICLTAQ